MSEHPIFHEHDLNEYKSLAIELDAQEKCSRWDMLKSVMLPNGERRVLIQQGDGDTFMAESKESTQWNYVLFGNKETIASWESFIKPYMERISAELVNFHGHDNSLHTREMMLNTGIQLLIHYCTENRNPEIVVKDFGTWDLS